MHYDFRRIYTDFIIREYTDQWGPFRFSFADALPSGTTITNARVYGQLNGLGSDIVEPEAIVASGTNVDIKLQWPGAEQLGKHELWFDLTLSGGAKHRFKFAYVTVE